MCSGEDGNGKSSLNMNFADYYSRVINWPGRTALVVALAAASVCVSSPS